jgi:hypothetical protein
MQATVGYAVSALGHMHLHPVLVNWCNVIGVKHCPQHLVCASDPRLRPRLRRFSVPCLSVFHPSAGLQTLYLFLFRFGSDGAQKQLPADGSPGPLPGAGPMWSAPPWMAGTSVVDF